MGGDDVRAAAAAAGDFLASRADEPWSVTAPAIGRSVAHVVAHVCESLLWYSADLWAGTSELNTVDLAVRPSTPPEELIRTLSTYASVLAGSIDAAPPHLRGFHPAGSPDPSGFAAMACDEILVHTADAAEGLGAEFTAPTALSQAVVSRLFPEAPRTPDPWSVLLWANGRRDLPGLPHQHDWRWHCDPLEEGDAASSSSSAR